MKRRTPGQHAQHKSGCRATVTQKLTLWVCGLWIGGLGCPGTAFVGSTLAQTQPDALQVQGEYTGHFNQAGETRPLAVQLLAMADDQFRMIVFSPGLPGQLPEDGSMLTRRKPSEPTSWQDGKLIFRSGNGADVVTWVDGQLIASRTGQEKSRGKLERVVRKSDTEGLKPPPGAVVLFDGSSGDQFEAGGDQDPRVEGLLRQGVTSKQKFGGDFSLHIEFKLPFEPSKQGQGRGNSGVYLQGRYEVQVLDSFGLEGENNECGGIYGVKKPDVNMCYPPESWQTYDIDFQSARWQGDQKTANARLTVRHNGVLIHENVEIPGPTTAAPLAETPEPGYLYLQDHGSPVRYRNIWILPK